MKLRWLRQLINRSSLISRFLSHLSQRNVNEAPCYLQMGHTNRSNEFKKDEKLYRRYIPNKTYPPNDYFSEISGKEFIKGISTNRSKYSKNPNDVLWSFKVNNGKCIYELKSGQVIFTIIEWLV